MKLLIVWNANHPQKQFFVCPVCQASLGEYGTKQLSLFCVMVDRNHVFNLRNPLKLRSASADDGHHHQQSH
jgi:hypothetical protein